MLLICSIISVLLYLILIYFWFCVKHFSNKQIFYYSTLFLLIVLIVYNTSISDKFIFPINMGDNQLSSIVNFSFNPVTELWLFRSQSWKFFYFGVNDFNSAFIKILIFLPLGLLLVTILQNKFSYKKILFYWFWIIIFINIFRILLMILPYFIPNIRYHATISVWEIILNFIWFAIGMLIYFIFSKIMKRKILK